MPSNITMNFTYFRINVAATWLIACNYYATRSEITLSEYSLIIILDRASSQWIAFKVNKAPYLFFFLFQNPLLIYMILTKCSFSGLGKFYSQGSGRWLSSSQIPRRVQKWGRLWICKVKRRATCQLIFDCKLGLPCCHRVAFFLLDMFFRAAIERAEVLLSMKHGLVRLDNVWGVGGGTRPVKYLIKKVNWKFRCSICCFLFKSWGIK